MRIDLWLIAVLLGGLVFFVGFGMITDLSREYNESFDRRVSDVDLSGFENTSRRVDDIFGESKEAKDSILDEEISDTDAENSMFSGGLKTLRNIFGVTKSVGNTTQVVMREAAFGDESGTNIMVQVWQVLMTIVAILIIFAILNYIFRFQGR